MSRTECLRPDRWIEVDEVCRDDLDLSEVSERLDDAVRLINESLSLIPFETRGRQDIVDACITLEREGWG